MHVPATFSLKIIEFGEWLPYDLWLIKQNVLGGLGTAWTGDEYILGSSLGPKDVEYLPAETLISTCILMDLRYSSDVDPFDNMSRVVG